MKVSAKKMAASNSRTKLAPEKSECTTGVVSRQRSQAQSLIRLKDQRNNATLSHKEEDRNIKAKQLFGIIETFYSTLCDLPLEKLVNSSEPEAWIAEQEETLATLEQKLRMMGKEKDQEHYRWKLRSVSTILGNIRDNLAMLNRMNQLKNYCSGTQSSNYRSNRDSSVNSSKIKLGQFASDGESIKEMLNYDEYPIETSQVPKSDATKYPQIMAHTVNSEIESSEEEEETFTRSQVFPKARAKRKVPRQGENRNNSNKVNFTDKSCKSNLSNDIKDKTLTKVHVPPSKSQSSTINNLSTQHRYNNSRGLKLLSNEETKRSQIVQQEDSFKPDYNEYLELIKELKLQMMEKDKEIDRLLIEEQQFDETIQLFQDREKEKNTEILFLKENALSNDRERERLQSQIRRLNNEAQDLRETVRLQRQRYRKEQREKDKVQQKLTEQAQSKEELIQEISRLREQNKQLKKGERQMKEKLQIYTRKYFTLYSTSESLKEEMKSLAEQLAKQRQRNRSESRYSAVKKIIGHHKERLCSQNLSP